MMTRVGEPTHQNRPDKRVHSYPTPKRQSLAKREESIYAIGACHRGIAAKAAPTGDCLAVRASSLRRVAWLRVLIPAHPEPRSGLMARPFRGQAAAAVSLPPPSSAIPRAYRGAGCGIRPIFAGRRRVFLAAAFSIRCTVRVPYVVRLALTSPSRPCVLARFSADRVSSSGIWLQLRATCVCAHRPRFASPAATVPAPFARQASSPATFARTRAQQSAGRVKKTKRPPVLQLRRPGMGRGGFGLPSLRSQTSCITGRRARNAKNLCRAGRLRARRRLTA